MAPLDLTHQTSVGVLEMNWLIAAAEELNNEVAHFAAQLFKAGGLDVARSSKIFGFDESRRFMHDPNVVTMIDAPNLYEGFRAAVEVVTKGAQAGRTIVTPDPDGTIFVAVKPSAGEVIDSWQNQLSTCVLKEPA